MTNVEVAPPENGIAKVSAWLRESSQNERQAILSSAAGDVVTMEQLWNDIGIEAHVYLWTSVETGASAIRERMQTLATLSPTGKGSSALGVSEASSEELALLRTHLEAAMRDVNYYPETPYGAYHLRLGFGSYGIGHTDIHYWGSANASLIIGRFCSLGIGVEFFLDGNHHSDFVTTYPLRERGDLLGFKGAFHRGPYQNHGRGRIELGHDIWVGRGAVILSGVHVGTGAVIATRAVVTKDVPPYSVVAGNPARVVKSRFDPKTVARLLATKWWDFSHETIDEGLERLLSDDIEAFLVWAERERGRHVLS